MSVRSIFDHLRLALYLILTILTLVVAFFPEGWLCYYYITNEPDLVQSLLAPFYLFIAYCVSVLFFGVFHSQVVLRATLPYKINPGVYPHSSIAGRQVAIRLTADGIFKSMLKVFTFVPIIYEAIIFPKLMRLYGFKVGKNVWIGKRTWIDCALVEIGDNSVIGYNTIIGGHSNEGGKIIISPTSIGKNCRIDEYCIIAPGVKMGDNNILEAVSGIIKEGEIPPNGVWAGQPAKLLRARDGPE